jgi:hypothetical protein
LLQAKIADSFTLARMARADRGRIAERGWHCDDPGLCSAAAADAGFLAITSSKLRDGAPLDKHNLMLRCLRSF